MKFVVRCNTHRYYDCSDTPRSTRIIVSASNPEEARQIVCAKRDRDEQHGNRYIGLVFDAEPTNPTQRSNAKGGVMEERILKWIDEYQSGKSGIYPYQVALQVCAEFVIPIEEAQDYVAEHIKRVIHA